MSKLLGFWSGLIVMLLVCVALGFLVYWFIQDSELVFFSCSAFVVTWIALIVGGYVTSGCNERVENKHEYISASYELKSLVSKSESGTSMNGSAVFFLGIGGGAISKETEVSQYYYTIVNYPNKGSKIEKYEIDKTYVSEQPNLKQPYIEVYNEKYDLVYKNNFLSGGLFKPIKPSQKDNVVHYVLYVPEGTIQVHWDVDINN